jgi:hypothetical protein
VQMSNLDIENLGFDVAHYVSGRASIADLFRIGKRCGIYLLEFGNGEKYCGQAVDVTRRYCQHRKNHHDIEFVKFQVIDKEKLDEVEKNIIEKLESLGIKLRNIAFTSIPYGESDLDTIIPVEEQLKWIKDLTFFGVKSQRIEHKDLRKKYTKKFLAMKKYDSFNNVIQGLKRYARVAIPALETTEMTFWCISCLPKSNQEVTVFCRVNLNMQEVLTIYEIKGELIFSLHMAKSPLEQYFGSMMYKLKQHLLGIIVTNHQYAPGGQDQIQIQVSGVKNFLELLNISKFAYSIRLFNMRLMQKSACYYSRNHCFDLADYMIS